MSANITPIAKSGVITMDAHGDAELMHRMREEARRYHQELLGSVITVDGRSQRVQEIVNERRFWKRVAMATLVFAVCTSGATLWLAS